MVINWSVLQIRGNLVFVMGDLFQTCVQESHVYCGEAASLLDRPTRTFPKKNKSKGMRNFQG